MRPEVFRSKPLRALRTALHSLTTSKALEASGKSLVGRVSDALRDERWNDALSALATMRATGMVPKLGALCRWVRDCDAAHGGLEDPMVCTVIDAVLRTADPGQVGCHEAKQLSGITQHQPWRAQVPPLQGQPNEEEGGQETPDVASRFRAVLHVLAEDRQPPNKYDLRIYTSEPGTIRLSQGHGAEQVGRLDAPGIPGAFLLTNLLTPSECRQILRAAEAVGYAPDEPATGSKSILAHAFVWLADEGLNRAIYQRCEALLPRELCGGAVLGINSRWRVYRYEPGAVYRPHIDGAWPGSGLSGDGKGYMYDAFGDRWSRLTFLVYLNSQQPEERGFDGGCTTFFLPSGRVGWLDSRSVVPQAGCALVFPHGDSKGSLLHEGSAVTRGAKYVIRTEVLYSTSASQPPPETGV